MTRLRASALTALAASVALALPLTLAGPVSAAKPAKNTSTERAINDRANNLKFEGPRSLVSAKQRSAIDLRRVHFKQLKAGGAKVVFTVQGPLPKTKAARRAIRLEAFVGKNGSYEGVLVRWNPANKTALVTRALDATRDRNCRTAVKITKKRKAFTIAIPERCTWVQGDFVDAQMNALVRKGKRETFAHNRVTGTARLKR